MVNTNKVAKFLKDSVEELIKIDEGCCELKLDDDLSLFVGWSGGYDNQPDNTIIQSKNDPEYAINAGIKSNHEYLKTDFDWLNYPCEEESGEVWDSGITISPNEDYEKDAQWFVDQYAEIRAALDKGEIVLESKKVENVYKNEDITFQEIEARMDNAEDYADLYEAASLIADTGLRIDVENLIGQCEDDEDTIDEAVSIICSDLLDMYINDENVEHLREGKKVTESAEDIFKNNEEEDLAKYIFDEIWDSAYIDGREGRFKEYEAPDLDDVQYYYDENVTEEQYDKIVNLIVTALTEIPYYVDSEGSGAYIELNDNHTLWDIEAPEGYEDDGSFQEVFYPQLVEEACKDFKAETGVELKLLGRMGRHACVDVTFENIFDWKKLQDVQERLEQEVIDKSNKALAGELDESKNATEEANTETTSFEDKLLDTFGYATLEKEYGGYFIDTAATVAISKGVGDADGNWDENGGYCIYTVGSLVFQDPNVKGELAFDIQAPSFIKDKEGNKYGNTLFVDNTCDLKATVDKIMPTIRNTKFIDGDYLAHIDESFVADVAKDNIELGSTVLGGLTGAGLLASEETRKSNNKLEEKDTKQEYQDFCNDLGIDPQKKSSINKFLGAYAKNHAQTKGISTLQAELDKVKKELRESISKKVEAKVTDYIDEEDLDKIVKENPNFKDCKNYEAVEDMLLKVSTKGYTDFDTSYKVFKGEDGKFYAYKLDDENNKVGDEFYLFESKSRKEEGKEEYTLDNIDDAIHEVRSKIAKQRAYDRRRDAVCLSIGDDDAVYKPMYDELKRLNAIKKELQAKK